jgi:hypothetical protein
MAPMKKKILKEGSKKKMIMVRGYGDLIWGGRKKNGDISLFKWD